MLDNDKRKARRRPMRYTAWIALSPGKFHGCVLSDISSTGARIDVEDSKQVPDRFPLFLSKNGRARRVCTVRWRKPQQLGVKFELRLADAERAQLIPQVDGDHAPLAPAEPAPAEKV